jgi:hypothetical protein
MPSKRWALALGLCLLTEAPVHAQVIKGVMSIWQCE